MAVVASLGGPVLVVQHALQGNTRLAVLVTLQVLAMDAPRVHLDTLTHLLVEGQPLEHVSSALEGSTLQGGG